MEKKDQTYSEEDLTKPLNREYGQSEFSNTDYESKIETTTAPEQPQLKQAKITTRYQFDGLKTIHIWGYSVGHFYNDLCAAVWFNYLLFYLKTIRVMEDIAPYSMLGGQIFDGLATPIVGILSDRTKTKFGQRTPWYIFGTVIVTFTFLPIFIFQLLPDSSPMWVQYVYMISFPSIFNVGWASVQISNMSLVPSLTCSTTRRDILNSRRNTFTFVANLTVLTVALVCFQIFSSGKDAFEALAIFVVTVGLIATGFFMFFVREVPLVKRANQCQRQLKRILENPDQAMQEQLTRDQQPQIQNPQITSQKSQNSDDQQLSEFRNTLKKTKNPKKSVNNMQLGQVMLSRDDDIDFEVNEQDGNIKPSISSMKLALKAKQLQEKENNWKQWFRESLFYICGVIYMFARLYCNVLATMLQFYLVYVCKFVEKVEDLASESVPFQVALIPMLLYVFSSISSYFVETLFQKIGRKKTYFLGGFFAIITTVGYIFIDEKTRWLIYPVACLTGISQALCLNTAITLISDVIGCRGSQGAFVFGVYSFLDKFLTGIVMFLLTTPSILQFDTSSVRWITALIPAVSLVIAGICIAFIKTQTDGFKHGQDDKEKKNQSNEVIEALNKELAS